MIKFRSAALFCMVFVVLACAPLAHKKTHTQIVFSDTNPRMQFSGRGAGAGMMLMSTMGAAGIAIGVAIDEGIAKDIHANLTRSGTTLEDVVRQGVDKGFSQKCKLEAKTLTAICKQIGGLTVLVDKLGLIAKPGDMEYVLADFDFKLSGSQGSDVMDVVSSSDDVDGIAHLSFDEAKANSDKLRLFLVDTIASALLNAK